MIDIGDLLKKYSEIKNPNIEKEFVLESLRKINLNIKENQIFFRKNTLVLKVSPVQKNFIYIRKTDILNEIKKTIPDRMIDNISF